MTTGAHGNVIEVFEAWLASHPLSPRTRQEYARNVRAYLTWLDETPDSAGWQHHPLTDQLAAQHAARDYRRHLQTTRRLRPASINMALAAIDALCRSVGLQAPDVRRDTPSQAAPKALDEAAQRRLLRAADAAPIRQRALVTLLLLTALRIGEATALDVGDVRITARKGVLSVVGKGETQRDVPLNAQVRGVLDEWLQERAVLASAGERALWVSRTGARLSNRQADRDVRSVAAVAGLELSAHTLRHTCLTGLVRAGCDLVMVAELAGHRKLETTRRYTRPSDADREAALEALTIDY